MEIDREDMEDVMVSVIVCTFQQEQTIAQTLESILAQKTEYPFEIIIGEDWGTDNTREICKLYEKNYDNVSLLEQTENLGITANYVHCIKHARGKYIMGCAGDDYWHNPNKIQLQVDFMEAHPECVMCHTDVDILYTFDNTILKNAKKSAGIILPEGRIQYVILQGKDNISAVTICYRRSIYEEHVPADEFARRRFPREDWPIILVLAAYGDVLYIPVSTATYRVGQESITRTSDYDKIIKRAQQDMVMTQYLYTLFPEWGPFKDEPYFASIGYHGALRAAYRNNDYTKAHEFAKKDNIPSWLTRMTCTKPTFMLFRWIQIKRKRL